MSERVQAHGGVDATERRERAHVASTGDRGEPEGSELSWALRSVQRATVDVNLALGSRLGLRPLEFDAMNHVMTGTEPPGPAELSNRLGISTGSGTELVDRLETAGHVTRRRHEGDRRRVIVEPTEQALGRMLGELEPLFDRLDEVAQQFDEAERGAIESYLRGVAEVLRSFAAAPETARHR